MSLTWQEFTAGWLGGIGGLTVSHPIDTIKVRHQDGRGTITSAIKSTYKHEGLHGFYKGMEFPCLMSGVQNAVYFGVYANCLRIMMERKIARLQTTEVSPFLPLFASGCCAGLVQIFITTPVETIKIKLQTRTGVQKQGGVEMKHAMWKCLSNTYLTQGVRGFYKGFIATGCRDVPTGGMYICLYVYCDKYLKSLNINDHHSHMLSGGIAGTLSYAPATPFDVVKTRLQADNPDLPKYRGTRDCILKTFREDGFASFWRGFTPTCIRAFVSNAAVFIIYEHCLATLL